MSNRCGYDRKAVGAGERIGAIEHAFDPREGSPAEQIKDLKSGRGADVTIEISGSTRALHEAQLDRFMVKLSIGYPSPEEEVDVLKRRAERKNDVVALQAIISPETFLAMRAKAEESFVDPDVGRYMVDFGDEILVTSPGGSGGESAQVAGPAQVEARLGCDPGPGICHP